ncbi:MAG: nucleotidyl transferase AbiEii/AbiGii toxin family protein [Candidatus Micrarchaeota archaeon]
MEKKLRSRYQHILESLEDIADCTNGELVLIGGTALAVFYLKHRVSVDLDFVPIENKDDVELKEKFKGALSRKGYNTGRTTFTNQFVIQFGDSSVRVEVFQPKRKIKQIDELYVGEHKIKVASLADLLEMKIDAYSERKEARDIYDIVSIFKKTGEETGRAVALVKEYGKPKNLEELKVMVNDAECYSALEEVLKHAD